MATEELSLEERIHALTPELFNMIYDSTMAITPSVVDLTDREFKPPVQCSIDKASRQAAMATFYSTTIFRLPEVTQANHYDATTLFDWLNSVPERYRHMITEVQIPTPRPGVVFSPTMARFDAQLTLYLLTQSPDYDSFALRNGVLQCSYWVQQGMNVVEKWETM